VIAVSCLHAGEVAISGDNDGTVFVWSLVDGGVCLLRLQASRAGQQRHSMRLPNGDPSST
jgi:hypothetical protein